MVYCKMISQQDNVIRYAIGALYNDLTGILVLNLNEQSYVIEKQPDQEEVYEHFIDKMLRQYQHSSRMWSSPVAIMQRSSWPQLTRYTQKLIKVDIKTGSKWILGTCFFLFHPISNDISYWYVALEKLIRTMKDFQILIILSHAVYSGFSSKTYRNILENLGTSSQIFPYSREVSISLHLTCMPLV